MRPPAAQQLGLAGVSSMAEALGASMHPEFRCRAAHRAQQVCGCLGAVPNVDGAQVTVDGLVLGPPPERVVDV